MVYPLLGRAVGEMKRQRGMSSVKERGRERERARARARERERERERRSRGREACHDSSTWREKERQRDSLVKKRSTPDL